MALTYYGTSRAVIDSPGDYTIDRDLTQSSPSEAAIFVMPGVHFVTIRLRSRLVGTTNNSKTAAGIEASGSAALTVLGDGGSISGFAYGVRLDNCYRARVRGVVVTDALFRGITISGDEATVEGCDVRNVTGATWTPNAYCMGIEVQGTSGNQPGRPTVIRNYVSNVAGMGSGESVGISISDKGRSGVVLENTLRNDSLKAGSFGVWVGGQSDVLVAKNVFDAWSYGVAFSSPPTGKVSKNVFSNCTLDVFDASGDVVIEH